MSQAVGKCVTCSGLVNPSREKTISINRSYVSPRSRKSHLEFNISCHMDTVQGEKFTSYLTTNQNGVV